MESILNRPMNLRANFLETAFRETSHEESGAFRLGNSLVVSEMVVLFRGAMRSSKWFGSHVYNEGCDGYGDFFHL